MPFQKANAELRPVVGFEDVYVVSSGGAIFRVKEDRRSYVGKRLSQNPDRDGYLKASLRVPGKFKSAHVHRVVASAFLGPKPAGMTVNHIDGDKQNNSAANLEYLTSGDNSRHAASFLTGRPTDAPAHATRESDDRNASRPTHPLLQQDGGLPDAES